VPSILCLQTESEHVRDIHPGFRPAHAKGILLTGVYASIGSGLTDARAARQSPLLPYLGIDCVKEVSYVVGCIRI
jgi:hypothetical protein